MWQHRKNADAYAGRGKGGGGGGGGELVERPTAFPPLKDKHELIRK